ncbi:MAG TPA: zeta toxin family protein, partial [Pirellulales bacterium]|nr:zeta toxin family protein [Pirellulales bacterium]
HNLIYDVTGKNAEKMVGHAEMLSKAGYEVHVIHVRVPAYKAAYKAWMRFRKNAFGNHDPGKDPGRFVPVDYAGIEVDDKPDETYKQLREHPAVKSWVQAVPEGGKVTITDRGRRE